MYVVEDRLMGIQDEQGRTVVHAAMQMISLHVGDTALAWCMVI
jgi:hypothetical protein